MRVVAQSLLSIFFLVVLGSPASADTVTTCGQTVTGDSVLAANLDCVGFPKPAVTIASGSLAMNGFTIKGSETGVKCEKSCRITGPGTITEAGIGISAYGKLDLRGVDAVGNEYIGVQCFVDCRVIGPANLSDNGEEGEPLGEGIRSTGTMKLDHVTVANNLEYGVNAKSYPTSHGKLDARNSTFTGNGIGIWADKSAKLRDSSVTGNVLGGILLGEAGCPKRGSLVLKNTAVASNDSGADCGTTVSCADLMTCKRPKVGTGASCETSYVIDSGLPGEDWGVCSAD